MKSVKATSTFDLVRENVYNDVIFEEHDMISELGQMQVGKLVMREDYKNVGEIVGFALNPTGEVVVQVKWLKEEPGLKALANIGLIHPSNCFVVRGSIGNIFWSNITNCFETR